MMRTPLRQVGDFVTGRECGPCQACCSALGVAAVAKPEWEPCAHQCASGCAVYQSRPRQCAEFACLWLQGQLEGDERGRPDVIGLVLYVVDHAGKRVVHARECRDGASMEPAARYLLDKLRNGVVVVETKGGVEARRFGRVLPLG